MAVLRQSKLSTNLNIRNQIIRFAFEIKRLLIVIFYIFIIYKIVP